MSAGWNHPLHSVSDGVHINRALQPGHQRSPSSKRAKAPNSKGDRGCYPEPEGTTRRLIQSMIDTAQTMFTLATLTLSLESALYAGRPAFDCRSAGGNGCQDRGYGSPDGVYQSTVVWSFRGNVRPSRAANTHFYGKPTTAWLLG
jgi:hypothetical protein